MVRTCRPKAEFPSPTPVALQPGEVLTAAVVEFQSRSHRDEVMEKVTNDPRVAEMMKQEQIANMEQMICGGFEMIVEA